MDAWEPFVGFSWTIRDALGHCLECNFVGFWMLQAAIVFIFVLAVWLLFELGREVRGAEPREPFRSRTERVLGGAAQDAKDRAPSWMMQPNFSKHGGKLTAKLVLLQGMFRSLCKYRKQPGKWSGWVGPFSSSTRNDYMHQLMPQLLSATVNPSKGRWNDAFEDFLNFNFLIFVSQNFVVTGEFSASEQFLELHQKLAVPWLKRWGPRVRQRVVTFLWLPDCPPHRPPQKG